jgi:predicted acylesterase/phospholipase RssA
MVDGGVLNNTPLSHAIALGAREIYVLPTGAPCPLDFQPMDFGHADWLMTRAEADARAFLDGRDGTVVPLRRTRAPRRVASEPWAELPPAS